MRHILWALCAFGLSCGYRPVGDINTAALHATGPGFFNTTSGDLAIGLAQAPAAEMTLQTVSGDAVPSIVLILRN